MSNVFEDIFDSKIKLHEMGLQLNEAKLLGVKDVSIELYEISLDNSIGVLNWIEEILNSLDDEFGIKELEIVKLKTKLQKIEKLAKVKY